MTNPNHYVSGQEWGLGATNGAETATGDSGALTGALVDVAHAVALEREAIAAWLAGDGWDNCGADCQTWRDCQEIAARIRNGAHNEGAGNA